MRGFFRRWFGENPPQHAPVLGERFFLDMACDHCGERFHLHINRATDCLQVFGEAGIAWRLQREVVGACCRTRLQVRVDLDARGQLVSRDILNGRFLAPEDVTSTP